MPPPTRRTALVAGAGGFLGGHLVRALVARGYAVRAVDVKPKDRWNQLHPEATNFHIDLRDHEATSRATEGTTDVFNLTHAEPPDVPTRRELPSPTVNVLVNINLLLAARELGVERYFYASAPHEQPFSERICQSFRRDFGLETRIARIHETYGPHGHWRGDDAGSIEALCRRALEAKFSGRGRIELAGDGHEYRGLLFVDDCIEGILRIHEGPAPDPIELGTREMASTNRVVGELEDLVGYALEREYDPSRPARPSARPSNNTRLLTELGWEPTTTLSAGLRRTLGWVAEVMLEEMAAPIPGATAPPEWKRPAVRPYEPRTSQPAPGTHKEHG